MYMKKLQNRPAMASLCVEAHLKPRESPGTSWNVCSKCLMWANLKIGDAPNPYKVSILVGK